MGCTWVEFNARGRQLTRKSSVVNQLTLPSERQTSDKAGASVQGFDHNATRNRTSCPRSPHRIGG